MSKERLKPKNREVLLNVFDFDGTLFRSPAPNPELWHSKLIGRLFSPPQSGGFGWFQELITLSSPFVPEKPGEEWFVQDILQHVKRSMEDENCVTVLLTGRSENYGERIKQILTNQGLKFDFYGFKPLPSSEVVTTASFKESFIINLIEKLDPKETHIWEDRPKHAQYFLTRLGAYLLQRKQKKQTACDLPNETKRKNRNNNQNHQQPRRKDSKSVQPETQPTDVPIYVHKVQEQNTYLPKPMEMDLVTQLINKYAEKQDIEMSPSFRFYKFITYSGVVLAQQSKQFLLNNIPPPVGWTVKADHMTIILAPLSKLPEKSEISVGQSVSMKVKAVGRTEHVLAVQVDTEGKCPSVNPVPHVTIAIAPGASSKDSNQIAKWQPIHKEIILYGLVKQVGTYGLPKAFLEAEAKKLPASSSPLKSFPIGKIVLQYHPHLRGKLIGQAIEEVKEWIKSSKLSVTPQNQVILENYIKSKIF